ncbi:MAG: hypothetical protein LLG02_10135 [Pelosinus sp.]|nr:hypothetical protein [Pelosinus sp.]
MCKEIWKMPQVTELSVNKTEGKGPQMSIDAHSYDAADKNFIFCGPITS